MAKAAGLVVEGQRDNTVASADRTRVGCVGWDSFIPCLRCGACCTGHQVPLDLIEARRICDGLGLSWYTFSGNYIEPLWTGADSFLIHQRDGACVFLKHTNQPYRTTCLIHAWKPSACREWTPSLHRRECQEGLLRYWGLIVTPEGELQGSDEKIQRFQVFMESLKKISAYQANGQTEVVGQYGKGRTLQYYPEESL